MADTNWASLREKCEANGCKPVFRAETVNGEVRFSLSAMKPVPGSDDTRVYDIRRSVAWDDAPREHDDMCATALAEWWV